MIGDVPPDFPKIYWLVWLIVGFGAFEYYAIATDRGNWAFSYFVYWIIGTGEENREWFRWLARGLLAVFFVWVIQHFFTGGNIFK